jgi:hypothetical protein
MYSRLYCRTVLEVVKPLFCGEMVEMPAQGFVEQKKQQ